MRPARSALLVLTFLLAAGLTQPLLAQQPTANNPDEQTLKKAGLATDAAALLDFFHKRSPGAVKSDQVQTWVKQLADKDAAARDRAAAELVGLGSLAVPSLRRAANDFDNPDAAVRART